MARSRLLLQPGSPNSEGGLDEQAARLFITEGDQGVDAGGAAGRNPAGNDAGEQEQGGYGAEGDGVVGGDAPELGGDDAGYGQAGNDAEKDAAADQPMSTSG